MTEAKTTLTRAELHFGRDAAGNEIDLLATRGDTVITAVECKSGRTVTTPTHIVAIGLRHLDPRGAEPIYP